ncbi:hypothetical protein BC739_005669 [Kutzneria viridogrisea]|uniref:Uncharacterized protein n=1 Tax=Kutzneria viridogrisea TaxID=47990 RepID=A0ABR6BNG5_9PSEU|nr:hypothetical protein [Kutzneria viridogrisea]
MTRSKHDPRPCPQEPDLPIPYPRRPLVLAG